MWAHPPVGHRDLYWEYLYLLPPLVAVLKIELNRDYTAAVTSSVHPRADVPYPQVRSCNPGWGRLSSVDIGGWLVPDIT